MVEVEVVEVVEAVQPEEARALVEDGVAQLLDARAQAAAASMGACRARKVRTSLLLPSDQSTQGGDDGWLHGS
jgi:hypothetical protein